MTMKKGKKYTITLTEFDQGTQRYRKRQVELSVEDARRAYDDACASGVDSEVQKACATLNRVREAAGQKIPVC